MEYIFNLLVEKYGEKYSYLKLYEVVYNKYENLCTIFFLYPETVKEIKQEEKDEIKEYLKEAIEIQAAIDVRFKKSFLDDNLIFNVLKEFLKKNYISLFSYFKEEQLSINKSLENITITISLEKSLYEFANQNNVSVNIKDELERNFCATFEVFFKLDESEFIDDKILGKMEREMLARNSKAQVHIPRYEIQLLEKIFGRDFPPYPEYIKNNTKEKTDVILAGEIQNIEKKSYVPKRFKEKGEEVIKYYYNFDLKDGDGRIAVKYFTTKTNMKYMDRLENGNKVAILGDIRAFNGKNSLHIKSIWYCDYDEERREFKPEKIRTESYNVVFPKPYETKFQEDLFSKRPEYNELVKNNDIVVYDLETTGLNYELDQIIEIGAVKIRNGDIIETFATLVKPTISIPEEASKVNNITDEMVANAPDVETVLHDFMLFAKDCVITGYNNVLFDDRFISYWTNKFGIPFENESVDTMVLAKQNLKLNNYKLATVTKRLEIKLIDAHRALNDTIATAKVFLKLNEIQ